MAHQIFGNDDSLTVSFYSTDCYANVMPNIRCPWCGLTQFIQQMFSARLETACEKCKGQFEVKFGIVGDVKNIKKITQGEKRSVIDRVLRKNEDSPSVKIGKVYGNVSIGGDVNVTNIYNETIKLINNSKSINDEQKSQTIGILDYVKNNAQPFLPVIADVIKRALGL